MLAKRALIFIGALVAASTARADDREWRLSLIAVPSAVNSSAAGSRGWGFNLGGRFRFTRGVTDYLELGGVTGFSWAPGVMMNHAIIDVQPGDLRTDVLAVEMGGVVRLIGDLPVARSFFMRNRPFVELRGGLLLQSSKQCKSCSGTRRSR